MKKPQWIALTLTAIALLGVYLFADTQKPATKTQSPPAKAAENESSFDFDGYLSKVKANIDADTLKLITALEKNTTANASALAALYHRKGESIAEAYYTTRHATANHDLPQLLRAGDLYAATSGLSQDERLTAFLRQQALAAYQTAVAWDTTNTENKIRLATAYMDEGSQPMKGVSLLLGIVRSDSTNADAQFLLGKFGLVSQQYDKAIARLEKVIYLRPRNYDALFLLANAYLNTGEKQKALNALERCVKLVDKPALKKEIEGYIANVKAEMASAQK